MGIILAILLFSLIIIIHELGHFTLAKLNGIRVDEFSLGMGPTLFGWEFKGTKFSLKLLPLGGACMMGEDDADDQSEGSFNSKSVWARISVIAAGPVFNFILALLMSAILVGAAGYAVPVIQEVEPGSSGSEQGLKKGDVITQINGKNIHIYEEFQLYNLTHGKEDTAELTVERDGKEHQVDIKPRMDEETGMYLLGLTGKAQNEKADGLKALQYGVYEVKYWICTTLDGLKMLVTGKVGLDQMAGPVGIVNLVDDTYEAAKPAGMAIVFLNLMNIGILLSANLGVMNLLPIPALDGGRLVFLILEVIRGKRIAPEKEGMVHFAGFVLLFGLMILILFNDVKNLFL